MADDKLAELFKTQKSLTEWLEDIKHKDVLAIRHEDNEKRERLKILNEIIGLPYDKAEEFEASDLIDQTPRFKNFFKKKAQESCALRLVPKEPNLPKIRMRGRTVAGAHEWFKEQKIDATKYRADFIPHYEDYNWATIFVVNKHGIQGEIIYGAHSQLTQGFHNDKPPLLFRFDFKNWNLYPEDKEALKHLKKLAKYLYVPEKIKQKELGKKLNAKFVNDYLYGYFETADASGVLSFLDYSQALGNIYRHLEIKEPSKAISLLRGRTGAGGLVTGKVHIVDPDNINEKFPAGAILVCKVTTPNYVPLMQRAGGIITDQGGILSHAAIVARELDKPCIVGTGNATTELKDGQTVTVDADNGTVTLSKLHDGLS